MTLETKDSNKTFDFPKRQYDAVRNSGIKYPFLVSLFHTLYGCRSKVEIGQYFPNNKKCFSIETLLKTNLAVEPIWLPKYEVHLSYCWVFKGEPETSIDIPRPCKQH
ncbi:hypothetical protein ABEB36_011631 [Hypothenemus hampei]|uniref:Uncharacterized protein n=1 Tax=Hypothenemus hampei TaxID=57062 RepID=A0ABD1E8H0_HYPHA